MLILVAEFILFAGLSVALISRYSPIGRSESMRFNVALSLTGSFIGMLIELALYRGRHGALALFLACLLGAIAAELVHLVVAVRGRHHRPVWRRSRSLARRQAVASGRRTVKT